MNVLKQTKKTAADEARQIAKQMAREPYELAKNAAPNVLETADDKKTQPAAQDDFKLVDDQIQEVNEKELNDKTRKRIQELEDEIEKIRRERKAKEEEWAKQQEAALAPPKEEEQPFVMPAGKKKGGVRGFIKKKQGTKEMGKKMSG